MPSSRSFGKNFPVRSQKCDPPGPSSIPNRLKRILLQIPWVHGAHAAKMVRLESDEAISRGTGSQERRDSSFEAEGIPHEVCRGLSGPAGLNCPALFLVNEGLMYSRV